MGMIVLIFQRERFSEARRNRVGNSTRSSHRRGRRETFASGATTSASWTKQRGKETAYQSLFPFPITRSASSFPRQAMRVGITWLVRLRCGYKVPCEAEKHHATLTQCTGACCFGQGDERQRFHRLGE